MLEHLPDPGLILRVCVLPQFGEGLVVPDCPGGVAPGLADLAGVQVDRSKEVVVGRLQYDGVQSLCLVVMFQFLEHAGA